MTTRAQLENLTPEEILDWHHSGSLAVECTKLDLTVEEVLDIVVDNLKQVMYITGHQD
jgi:hypothetical protein